MKLSALTLLLVVACHQFCVEHTLAFTAEESLNNNPEYIANLEGEAPSPAKQEAPPAAAAAAPAPNQQDLVTLLQEKAKEETPSLKKAEVSEDAKLEADEANFEADDERPAMGESARGGKGRRGGGGAPAASGSFSISSNRAGNSEESMLDEALGAALGVKKSFLTPSDAKKTQKDLGESAQVEDKRPLRQKLGLQTCASACEVAKNVHDEIGRAATCRTLKLHKGNCDVCPPSAQSSIVETKVEDDKPSMNPEDMALDFAGLPKENPVTHLAAHLGDSLQQHHVAGVMAKAQHMTQTLDAAATAVEGMHANPTEEQVDQVRPYLDRFFAAAKNLHPEQVVSSANDDVEEMDDNVAELQKDPEFQRKSKSMFKQLKGLVRAAKATQELGESDDNEESEHEDSTWPSFGGKKKEDAVGKAEAATDDAKAKTKEASAATERRRKGFGLGRRRRSDGKKKKRNPMKLCGPICRKAMKTLMSAVKTALWPIKATAKRIGKMLLSFLKKLGSMLAKPIKSFFANNTLFQKLRECTSFEHLTKPMKCSGGDLEGHNPRRCLNGGGDGSEWLWSEKVDIRKDPTTWVKKVPDSTECGDWTKPNGGNTKCDEAKFDYCDQRFFDGGVNSDWKAKDWKKVTENLPKVESMCECGVDPDCASKLQPGEDPVKCPVKKPCDKRCLLMKFDGVYQGPMRCVPRMNPKDPKYAGRMYGHLLDGSSAKKKTYHAYNFGSRKNSAVLHGIIDEKEQLGLTEKQQRTQKFFMQWQRPAQPFGGKFVGFRLANAPGADESQLNKAYKRTGDYCLDYKSPSPNTRIRCTNGQFHWGVDDSNWMICAGMDPQNMGMIFVERILLPTVKLIPLVGKKIAGLFGPSFKKMVSAFGGVVLDTALSNIPFFGPAYMTMTRIINDWVGIDLRNILTQKHPEQLISRHNGIMDYSIDKTQARMRKVYCGGECDAKLVEHLPAGDRCPDSTPVRAAMLTNERAGDEDLVGCLGSRWPGRQDVNIGSTNLEMSYLKSDLCLSLPVCDQRLMKGYVHQNGKNADCSGNGQCGWNSRKGNHCKCDKGFFGTLCEKEGSAAKGSNNQEESLGEVGATDSFIQKLESHRQSKDVAEASPKGHKHFDKEAACKRCAAGHNDDRDFKSKDCKECLSRSGPVGSVGKECPIYGGQDAMFPCNNWATKYPYQKEIGLNKNTGCDICEKSCEDSLDKERVRRQLACLKSPNTECGTNFAEAFQNPAMVVNGVNAVSAVCKEGGQKNLCGQKKYSACEKKGGQCVDLQKWTCSSNKHIIDCLVSREFAPIRTTLETDKICGKLLLGQSVKTKNVCSTGIRRNFQCSTDADCPCGGMATCDPKCDPEKGASCAKSICCNEKNKDNRSCFTFGLSKRKGLSGCKSKVMLDCDAVKMEKLATMGARL